MLVLAINNHSLSALYGYLSTLNLKYCFPTFYKLFNGIAVEILHGLDLTTSIVAIHRADPSVSASTAFSCGEQENGGHVGCWLPQRRPIEKVM